VDDGRVELIGLEAALDEVHAVLNRAANVLDVQSVTPTHYAYRGNMESGLFWSRLLGETVYYVSVVEVRVFSDHRVEVFGDGFGDDPRLLDVQRCANERDARTFADLLHSLRALALDR
jgi:hypothetical protein